MVATGDKLGSGVPTTGYESQATNGDVPVQSFPDSIGDDLGLLVVAELIPDQ
jgi:hypothetical protein